MLSLTANGEVPVLWVDGGTVAVMPCSRSIRYRAQGGEALREARQTRLTRGYSCRRLSRMPASRSLVFGECAFPPVSLGPAGDCPCKD